MGRKHSVAIGTLVDKHMWLAAAVFVHQLVQLNTTLHMPRSQAGHGRPEPERSRGGLTAKRHALWWRAERSLWRTNVPE
jgi:hypothetical protein|tara:strand:- start:1187 stop:1423 length:237 start_codon:yes stop_codon:yes gene_type:complete